VLQSATGVWSAKFKPEGQILLEFLHVLRFVLKLWHVQKFNKIVIIPVNRNVS